MMVETSAVNNHIIQKDLEIYQRRRWIIYIITGGLLGTLVGYYVLPQIHWYYGIVALLSLTTSTHLSIIRQYRRTWQYQHLCKLIDGIERIAFGVTIISIEMYALLSGLSPEDMLSIFSWTGLFILIGSVGGEYWWQRYCFDKLEQAEKLRYLSTCLHKNRKFVL